MLTISRPLSAGQAHRYHAEEFQNARDNYYTDGDRIRGEWHGQLAATWGLHGEVREEHFRRLADGQHPINGKQIVRHQTAHAYTNERGETGTTMAHRAGWDATFSAPKSVSLTALVGGDERVRDAHQESVTAALDEIERYIQARLGGDRPAETTSRWVAARFDHDSARPVDGYAAPQLHTHVVLFNLTETADAWNASVEQWMYVADSDIARALGIAGHYVTDQKHLVSPDALALVRFGLRSPHDPRIRDTITAIDHVLRSDTATGPVWHRFIGDQYGEHEDGSGYDGAGIGRGWPLLAGERAHYEVAAGHSDRARQLARVMVAQANRARLLPEQVWDAADIPGRDLRNGHPTGGAMPLVWAHAEFLKLCRSIADGCVFDMPPQTVKRYVAPPRVDSWRRPSPRARRVTGHGY